jgi:hypothetical protein
MDSTTLRHTAGAVPLACVTSPVQAVNINMTGEGRQAVQGEGVSDLLITYQTDTLNSSRLIKRPITKSCMCSVLEKQIVRRTNRLIRVRKFMCLLSIFWGFAFPT